MPDHRQKSYSMFEVQNDTHTSLDHGDLDPQFAGKSSIEGHFGYVCYLAWTGMYSFRDHILYACGWYRQGHPSGRNIMPRLVSARMHACESRSDNNTLVLYVYGTWHHVESLRPSSH